MERNRFFSLIYSTKTSICLIKMRPTLSYFIIFLPIYFLLSKLLLKA